MTQGSIINRPLSSTSQRSVYQVFFGKEPDKEPFSFILAGQHDHCPFPGRARTHRRSSIGSSKVSDVVQQRRMFRSRKSLEEARQHQERLETSNTASSESIPDLSSLMVGTADEECFIHRQLEKRPVEPSTQLKSEIFGEYEVGLKGSGISMMMSSSRTTEGDLDGQQNPAHQHECSRNLGEESCRLCAAVFLRNDHHATTPTTTSNFRRSGSTGELDNRSSWGRHCFSLQVSIRVPTS
jgi:hypothetical protein